MERLVVPTQLPFDHVLVKPDGARRLIVLLHGYQESGERIFKKLSGAMPADAVVLAPNGLFPLPERKDGGYRVGFSWYFYDPASKEYYIDMKAGLEFLVQGIRGLGLEGLPLTVIGFSQGGYIAPFLGQRLGAKQVIGICSEFLPDEMEGEIGFQADLIAGADDDIVTRADPEESDRKMRARGVKGKLYMLEGVGHRIEPAVVVKVSEILTHSLQTLL